MAINQKLADGVMSGQEIKKQENTFNYTYSAPQQDEVKKIREKYLPKQETPIEQLRRLDEAATKRGTILAITHGAISALVLGIGMSCCMVGNSYTFIPGIVIGCVGFIGAAMAHPIFTKITQKERERVAPEILRLTEELLK